MQNLSATYERFLIFQIMYNTACQSSKYEFRLAMYTILERISMPIFIRNRRGWHNLRFWGQSGGWFTIHANLVGNLKTNLRRIKWTEELKMVRYFLFRPIVSRYFGGRELTWNREIYDKIAAIIPTDRIIVHGRQQETDNGDNFGLPKLPHTYRILECLEDPPFFKKLPASEYHCYFINPY